MKQSSFPNSPGSFFRPRPASSKAQLAFYLSITIYLSSQLYLSSYLSMIYRSIYLFCIYLAARPSRNNVQRTWTPREASARPRKRHKYSSITRPHFHCFSDPRFGALSPSKLRVHPLKWCLFAASPPTPPWPLTHFVRSKSSSLAYRLAFVINQENGESPYQTTNPSLKNRGQPATVSRGLNKYGIKTNNLCPSIQSEEWNPKVG